MAVEAERSGIRRVAGEPIAFARELIAAFAADECPRRAAALSYYTVFAVPGLIVLTILIGGVVVGEDTVESQMTRQATRVLGDDVEDQARTIIQNARDHADFSFSALLGAGALFLGAIGAFSLLQSTFNAIWNVRPRPEHRGIRHFIRRRALSAGMLLVAVFLVLSVLLMTTASVGVSTTVAGNVASVPAQVLLVILNGLAVLAFLSVLFAAMFMTFPDARLGWRDVWLGAVLTAILFIVGQVVIVFGLGQTQVTNTFGAAGSFVIILIWIYYSGVIIFAGGEFTRLLARWQGHTVEPTEDAEKIEISGAPAGNLTEAPDKS